MSRFGRCRCFLQSNIYLPNFGLHVAYLDEAQFTSTYGEQLRSLGCNNINNVIHQVREELSRRRRIPSDSQWRTERIRDDYRPLHPDLYSLKEKFLHPDLLELCRIAESSGKLESCSLLQHHQGQVYSFEAFTAEFCQRMAEELRHFQASDMPKGRPNSMNNYGVLLDELGLDDGLLKPLRDRYLAPLCRRLFPDETSAGFDSHKVFSVEYEPQKDVELDFHFDNAEVTANICLSAEDCDGGELFFGQPDGGAGFGYVHTRGRAVLHRGSAVHAVLPLVAGRRVNVVLWMRSSAVRNRRCPMCRNRPHVEAVPHGSGDGFTVAEVC